MKQLEMSKYLKVITIGAGILFLAFVGWFLPSIFWQVVLESYGTFGYGSACAAVWITAVPVFLCLWKFWGICVRIGKDESFSKENAKALKQMSHFLLVDCILYALILTGCVIWKWYVTYGLILLFGIFLILMICISLTVLCASLSHLVYKASQLQEDQDLTI